MEGNNRVFNLEERTQKFGESIIDFVKSIEKNVITNCLIFQITKSGTSVGANYCEADCAESKKDFIHKIGISNKETKETKYWLRMIAKAVPANIDQSRKLWKEAHELNLIFTSIIKKAKTNLSKELNH